MKKIPMLEKFAAQSLVECDGELIFSKEKFAELIVQECIKCCDEIADINRVYREERLVDPEFGPKECISTIKKHFGVES